MIANHKIAVVLPAYNAAQTLRRTDRRRGSCGYRLFNAQQGPADQPGRERRGYAGSQSWGARIDAVHHPAGTTC
jgi:hypothetical protein